MNHTTELVFILDRSGSMEGLEKDTIGGFNSMISKQVKRLFPLCFLTTRVWLSTIGCRLKRYRS